MGGYTGRAKRQQDVYTAGNQLPKFPRRITHTVPYRTIPMAEPAPSRQRKSSPSPCPQFAAKLLLATLSRARKRFQIVDFPRIRIGGPTAAYDLDPGRLVSIICAWDDCSLADRSDLKSTFGVAPTRILEMQTLQHRGSHLEQPVDVASLCPGVCQGFGWLSRRRGSTRSRSRDTSQNS